MATDADIDIDGTIAMVRDDIRPRLVAAALYHKQMVWNETLGGGKPAEWESTGEEAAGIFIVINVEHLGWKIVVPAFYAAFQEFGSRHEPAKPFMRPASEKAIPGIIDILEGKGG